ncbi:MAG: kelch repeat-containing protein [Elusimicrobiota bacterium]|nr:kelch repeat-containing protein [Elusimicrobiota bacterium]
MRRLALFCALLALPACRAARPPRPPLDAPPAAVQAPRGDGWRPGASMAVSRTDATGAWAGGRFFVFGGSTQRREDYASVESFDPLTGRWTAHLDSPVRRAAAAAAALDGVIFVVGGCLETDCSFVTPALWAFDTATGRWSPRKSMPTARFDLNFEAIDGKLYAAGGVLKGFTMSRALEIYDPKTDSWSRGPSAPLARGQSASAVIDGRLYLAGGRRDNGEPRLAVADLQIYDAATRSWSIGPSQPAARFCQNGAARAGELYAVGGAADGAEDGEGLGRRVFIYDPRARAWRDGPPLYLSRYGPAVASDGARLYAAGGAYGNTPSTALEILEGSAPAPSVAAAAPPVWTPGPDMSEPRANHAAVRLADGRVMVAGGQSGYAASVTATTEFFDPATDAWTPGPPMGVARYDFPMVRLKDGRYLAFSGRGAGKQDLAFAELYDPKTGRWSRTGSLSGGRSSCGATLLRDGRVLACGGFRAGVTLASCESYDPATGRWTPAAPMRFPRQTMGFQTLPDGRVLAVGGVHAPDTVVATVEVYDPAADAWSPGPPLSSPRSSFALVPLADGRLFVTGGIKEASGKMLETAELYDPADGRWTRVANATPAFGPAGALHEGKPLVIGGHRVGPLKSAAWFDPVLMAWNRLPNLAQGRVYHSVTPLADGRVLVAGGEDGPDALAGTEILRVAAATAADAAPRAAPRRPERPHDFAVVIGVEGYRALPAAAYADNDAVAAAAALRDLGVPQENTVLLRGERAGLAGLAKYLEEWLPRRVTEESRVFVYFSGHGAPDATTGAAHLMPWDGDAAFVRSTGFSLERLYAALEKLPAREVVVALDSCFSGAGGRSVLAPGLRPLVSVRLPERPRRVSVLAASEAGEVAGGLPSAGHGAFTHHLVAGLAGAADADSDGHLTLEELHAYARKRVIVDARAQDREQTPTLSTPTPGLLLY